MTYILVRKDTKLSLFEDFLNCLPEEQREATGKLLDLKYVSKKIKYKVKNRNYQLFYILAMVNQGNFEISPIQNNNLKDCMQDL